MYQAYASEDVITRLQSLDPTCFSSSVSKSKLFIGTKQGHLLGIDQVPGDKRGFASVVNRSFEKKAITDLQVIESQDLILCLCDGQINAHEYNDGFKQIATFNKYKPISSFSSYVQMPDNRLFILICVRKRLCLLKWLIDEFAEVRLEFTPNYLVDNPTLLTWCGKHSVYFAVKGEYFYVRIFEEQLSSSSSGNNDEIGAIRPVTSTLDTPLIVNLKELGFVGLAKGNQIEFYNEHGNRVPHLENFKFSDTPIALAYDAPYLVGILPKGLIEIRSIQPEMFIQKLSFNKAAYIHTAAPGYVFVASDHAVWKMDARPLARGNVKFLANEKHFELAVNLAEKTPDLDQKEMVVLKRKLATNLFLQQEYEKCFNIHLEINTDVLLVLNLMPKLIPKKYLYRLSKYSHTELEDFEGSGVDLPQNKLKTALNPLADYLLAKRTEFGIKLEQHQKAKKEQRKDLLLGSKEVQRIRDGLELVHTAMLKCYLKTKPMLISSLLKLPDNSCIVEEAENDLKEANLPYELLILYERKERHREALELLKEQAHVDGSPLFGLEHVVEYLQNLGEEHLPLVFEHAKWILAEDLEKGTEIFCSTANENIQRWECEEILHFLRHECIQAIIPYLEHIIHRHGEQRPKLHETLAEQYIVKVKQLMKDYIHALSDNDNITKGGEEDGDLGIYRKKLMNFLQESHFYGPQKILTLLDDHLIEEKAIVFGRLKRHREALLIYTQILADFETAERHCIQNYHEDDPLDSEVFFEFYKVCIDPGELPKDVFNTRLLVKRPQSNANQALKILKNHSTKLDTIKAISLIPSDTPLNKVFAALEATIETTKNRVSSTGILLAISNLARNRIDKELTKNESLKILIDYNVDCILCGKRIATSAFVRYTNGNIAHFFCYRNSGENSTT